MSDFQIDHEKAELPATKGDVALLSIRLQRAMLLFERIITISIPASGEMGVVINQIHLLNDDLEATITDMIGKVS